MLFAKNDDESPDKEREKVPVQDDNDETED